MWSQMYKEFRAPSRGLVPAFPAIPFLASPSTPHFPRRSLASDRVTLESFRPPLPPGFEVFESGTAAGESALGSGVLGRGLYSSRSKGCDGPEPTS